MNGSPAICAENRVQRWQSTQRSRSSSTCVEIGIGFGNVRLCSTKRESLRPCAIAWFCSGHSPPLSQIGQSSGWLMSSSSITPCWALSATGEVSWVFTTMPSATVIVQEACGFGIGRPPISTSTRHWRQAPAGLQQRVVAEPRDDDAEALGRADQQLTLGRDDLDAVDDRA